MITFLLVVQIIVAAALVLVILMQRSEGGGLGIGGSPAGLMSARGAADFLTRTTTILAGMFIALCIALAGVAAANHASNKLDTSLVKTAPAKTVGGMVGQPVQPQGNPNDPLAALGAAQPSSSATAPIGNVVAPDTKK
jgi:preprotein translocase subunit SecG